MVNPNKMVGRIRFWKKNNETNIENIEKTMEHSDTVLSTICLIGQI